MKFNMRVGGDGRRGKLEFGSVARDLEADIHQEVRRRIKEAGDVQGRDFERLDQELVRAAILSVVSRLKRN